MAKIGDYIEVPLVDESDNDYTHQVIGNKNDTVGGDSLVSLTKQVVLAVGGEAIQMRVEQSNSGTVEEDAIMAFGISIIDVDTGAVTLANIDISGITQTLEKSTGGGAFSTAGITQPVFAKADGLVSVDYRFLAAEWVIGDVYKMTVSGITATIGSDTAYVKTCIWSNMVMEAANVEAKIDAIQADIGDPSARTNLQTLLALLGNPDTAGKSVYEFVKNIREVAINGSSLPIENTISDTLHKNGSYTYDNTTDSLEAISDGVSAVSAIVSDIGSLAYYGEVTTANSTSNFKILGLAGKGVNQFNEKYYCQVIEADGAAPEGEIQKVSAYTTADGDFTVAAFTAAPDVGDQVLIIHESLVLMFSHADATFANVADDSLYAHLCAVDGTIGDYDDNTMSLEALNIDTDAIIVGTVTNASGADVATDVVALQTDVGNPSARTNTKTIEGLLGVPDTAGFNVSSNLGSFQGRTNDQSLIEVLGVPDVAGKDLTTLLVTDRLDDATFGLSPIQVQVDDIQDKVDGTDSTATAYRREHGVRQVSEFAITAAANAGVTTVATVTTQPCLIKSVSLRSNGPTTGDLTTAAIEGGASQVIEFVGIAVAIQANLDAIDKQVSWDGAVVLPATKTITIDLQGGGATAVDFTVKIEYEACVDGGYLA